MSRGRQTSVTLEEALMLPGDPFPRPWSTPRWASLQAQLGCQGHTLMDGITGGGHFLFLIAKTSLTKNTLERSILCPRFKHFAYICCRSQSYSVFLYLSLSLSLLFCWNKMSKIADINVISQQEKCNFKPPLPMNRND